MVDMRDSKSRARKDMSVRVRPPAPSSHLKSTEGCWGFRIVCKDPESRKSLACNWVEVMRKHPEFAAKMREDRLTQADLFEVRRQLSTLIATMSKKLEFYPARTC